MTQVDVDGLDVGTTCARPTSSPRRDEMPSSRAVSGRVEAAMTAARRAHPSQRAGQVIVNALQRCQDPPASSLADLFYVDDEALAAALSRYAREASHVR